MSNKGQQQEQQRRRLVIGVDGGGTKTAVVCYDLTRHETAAATAAAAAATRSSGSDGAARGVAGTAVSQCTNWNSVGNEKAFEALREGMLAAVAAANGQASNVVAVCLGMSGVDREEDKTKVSAWIKEIFPHVGNVSINSDAVAALASGTAGELHGAVVISGTGMIVLGYNNGGRSQRAGGWGPMLGDEGSGYAIGMQVLRAVTWADDGRGPKTALSETLLSTLQLPRAEQLIPWAYRESDRSWQKFAALAPLATQCAAAGDTVAQDILDFAAGQLMHTVSPVVDGLGLADGGATFPLVLAGGNLTHSGSRLAELLIVKLRTKYPNCKPVFPSVEPAEAAALLAIKQFKLD